NTDVAKLPRRIRELCADLENELFLSVVSAWEIALKSGAGRLSLPEPPAEFLPKRRKLNGVDSLALDEETILFLPKLPPNHTDPFDRILVCQAIVHDLVILTPDEHISSYPVRVMW